MPQTEDLSNTPAMHLEVPPQSRPRLHRLSSAGTGVPRLSAEPLKNTILKSHGRPPWYGEDGKPLHDAFVIGIAGGSASGKTHVARQILHSLGYIPSVVIISQDSFYKKLLPEQLELAFGNKYDFDHPDALDLPEFASCISDLKKGRQTNIPIYSFTEHQRLKERRYLYGATVVIAEGIMTLHDPAMRALYDLKIFVKCDSDLMLARRISRDVKERGREVDGVLSQYLRFVKPAYDDFVLPTSRYADIIVPGSDNNVAIDLITTHIRRQLESRTQAFREKKIWSQISEDVMPKLHYIPAEKAGDNDLKIHVLEQTPQLKGIYTILRDKETPREDFIFFVDRLSTLLMENALAFLPFKPKTVITPTGAESHGNVLDNCCVCGVSILRSGGPLEKGLQRVVSDIRIGSLLIQTEQKTGEPLLLHTMLPGCLRDRARAEHSYVFLLDAQIGTGAAAFMALRVLLDHGVRPDHIVFVTFLVARYGGVRALRRTFPDLRIICGAVDDALNERWVEPDPAQEGEGEGIESERALQHRIWTIEPGMGQIGDRYYL